jgi:Polysaccharide lyase
MLKKFGLAAVLVVGALAIEVLLTGQAEASVIWTGDPAKSAGAVFGIDNCPKPGNIGVTNDATRGQVWRFNKPAGDKRCEAHGIKVGGRMHNFQNNSTYFLGWDMKLSSTVNNNANFQWKSYGNHIQNFPLVLKMIDGKLTLLNRQPGKKEFLPWSKPVVKNQWNKIVLGIHTSSELQGGWVEVYFNGVKQTFINGKDRWPCRTWDDHNDPKWGVYGAESTAVTNLVDGLKVGTRLADVR